MNTLRANYDRLTQTELDRPRKTSENMESIYKVGTYQISYKGEWKRSLNAPETGLPMSETYGKDTMKHVETLENYDPTLQLKI